MGQIVLETDASGTGIGGVLGQSDEGDRLRPIAFFSSLLNDTQRRYSAGEREAYAVVAAVRKFYKFLRAAPKVVILSDHNPLVYMRQQKDPRGKFSRWILEPEGINYEIIYRRGSENWAADYLSRSATVIDAVIEKDEQFIEQKVYSTQVNQTQHSGSELFNRVCREQKQEKQ